MNAAVAPYPTFGSKDFADSTVDSVVIDTWNYREREVLPLLPAFSFTTRPKISIAESVDQIVMGRAAEFSPTLRQRITELLNLKPNWDGEGAKGIKVHVLADVIEGLKRIAGGLDYFREPFLAPTFDGFVQMEWHSERRSLEIEAVDQGWSYVGTVITNDTKRWYLTAVGERSDFQKLKKYYEWYEGSELIWPLP
jgi:hypothetical protein